MAGRLLTSGSAGTSLHDSFFISLRFHKKFNKQICSCVCKVEDQVAAPRTQGCLWAPGHRTQAALKDVLETQASVGPFPELGTNTFLYLFAGGQCLVAQSCLTLWDPMDCSPRGFSVHGDSPGKKAVRTLNLGKWMDSTKCLLGRGLEPEVSSQRRHWIHVSG